MSGQSERPMESARFAALVRQIRGELLTRADIVDGGDSLLIHSSQDVTPIIEHNKRLQKETRPTASSWQRVACIPNIWIEKWQKEEGLDPRSKDFSERIARKLDLPEYQFFKTCPGVISERRERSYLTTTRAGVHRKSKAGG